MGPSQPDHGEGPLEFSICQNDRCGLFQRTTLTAPENYFRPGYGYKSSLNPSMIRHLKNTWLKVQQFGRDHCQWNELTMDAFKVLDIGSNDGTFLQSVSDHREKLGPRPLSLVGIDPLAQELLPDNLKQADRVLHSPYSEIGEIGKGESCFHFFSSFFTEHIVEELSQSHGNFNLISTQAMFYDLNNPMQVAQWIKKLLAPTGLWVVELMDLPSMVENNWADGLCHEHVAIYDLRQWHFLCDNLDLEIYWAEKTSTNGSSYLFFIGHRGMLKTQSRLATFEEKFVEPHQLEQWNSRIHTKAMMLRDFIEKQKCHGPVLGLGASTKGNMWLQLAQLGPKDIPAIGEINASKFGRLTPGSFIPIREDEEVRKEFDSKNTLYLVLPWHFKQTMYERYESWQGSLWFGLGHSDLSPLQRPERC